MMSHELSCESDDDDVGASNSTVAAVGLPASFLEFCSKHGIDDRMYSHVSVDSFPRFLRVNGFRRAELCGPIVRVCNNVAASRARSVTMDAVPQGALKPDELEALRLALGPSVTPVSWVPPEMCLCLMDGGVSLAAATLYVEGVIHGMDVSSAASIVALDPQPGDSVLDVCCAPGAKLCLIADMMQGRGSLVGVDYSNDRLAICATLLRKYRIVRTGELHPGFRLQLYGCDGRTFNVPPPHVATYAAFAGLNLASCKDPVKEVVRACMQTKTERPAPTGVSPCSPATAAPPPSVAARSGAGANAESASIGVGTQLSEATEVDIFFRSATDAMSECTFATDAALLDSLHENLFRKTQDCTQRGLLPIRKPLHLGVISRVLQAEAEHARTLTGSTCEGSSAISSSGGVYDRVLVDAECTHDGSLKHVAKFGSAWGWDALHDHVVSEGKAAGLQALQRGLLANGFRLLKPGGTLIYSTCSLTRSQNEDVVQWLLDTTDSAAVLPIPQLALAAVDGTGAAVNPSCSSDSSSSTAGVCTAGSIASDALKDSSAPVVDSLTIPPLAPAVTAGLSVEHSSMEFGARCRALHLGSLCPGFAGDIPGTIRFEPLRSGCSGLFIAKITKRAVFDMGIPFV